MKEVLKVNGNGEQIWKTDKDKFQGYVKAKLESIHEGLSEVKKTHRDDVEKIHERIDTETEKLHGGISKNGTEITNIKINAAFLGSLLGAAAGFVAKYIRWPF